MSDADNTVRQGKDLLGRQVTELEHSDSTQIIKLKGKPIGRRIWDAVKFPVGLTAGFLIASLTGADLRPYVFSDSQPEPDTELHQPAPPELLDSYQTVQGIPDTTPPVQHDNLQVIPDSTRPQVPEVKHIPSLRGGGQQESSGGVRIRFPTRLDEETVRQQPVDTSGWRAVEDKKGKKRVIKQ